MRVLSLLMVVLLAAGCAPSPPLKRDVDPDILRELDAATSQKRDARSAPSSDAELLAPLRMEMPAVRGQPIDQRFDLSVSNAPAQQVFMSLVAGTRYSMLLNPNVGGTISVNLKDVTLREALQSIRELYGYEYSIDGSRIYIQPIAIQTRIFQVNYLVGQRIGRSDIRVTSGSVADAPLSATPGIRWIDSDRFRSGNLAMSSARIVSDESSAVRFWSKARSRLPRKPVTITVSIGAASAA